MGESRQTLIRLTSFAGVWIGLMAVRLIQRGDAIWITKVGWMAAFAVPTIALMWLVQRLLRYRIYWLIELFTMPFAIGALIYVAIVIRRFVA